MADQGDGQQFGEEIYYDDNAAIAAGYPSAAAALAAAEAFYGTGETYDTPAGEDLMAGPATGAYGSEFNPIASEFQSQGPPPVYQTQQLDKNHLVPPNETERALRDQEELPPEEKLQQFEREWEFTDYRPKSYGWFGDFATAMALSLPFKIYFCGQLVSIFMLFLFICADYGMAVLFRLLAPTIDGVSSFWQSMGWLATFLAFSFFAAAFLCCILDLIRDFWRKTEDDHMLWGISHSDTAPPYFLYGIILLVVVLIPFLWATILSASRGRTGIYCFQEFIYVSSVSVIILIIVFFVWFYARALVEKGRSYTRRAEQDDRYLKKDVLGNIVKEEKKKKNSEESRLNDTQDTQETEEEEDEAHKKCAWYESNATLEEYGLDLPTVKWSFVVFCVGLMPLFIIYIIIMQQGRTAQFDLLWGTIGVAVFCILVILNQTAGKKHPGRYVAFIIGSIVLLVLLGVIGCAVVSNGMLIGVLLLLVVASQGFLLRKRSHQLTRKEICKLMKVNISQEKQEEMNEAITDTYVCCCKQSLFACCAGCVDIRSVFGYKHPAVSKREKEIMMERIALRSDQRVLLLYWLLLTAAIFTLVLTGGSLKEDYGGEKVAQRSTSILSRVSPKYPLCEEPFPYNAKNSSSLKLYDLALLSALGYSYGPYFRQDFALWFSHTSLSLVYPTKLPNDLEGSLGSNAKVQFYAFRDSQSNTDYIVIKGFMMGRTMLHRADLIADVVSLRAAMRFTPFIGLWPPQAYRDFISGFYLLRTFFYDDDFYGAVNHYARTAPGNVVIIGHGMNGLIAKMVGLEVQKAGTIGNFGNSGNDFLRVVTFNAPNIDMMRGGYNEREYADGYGNHAMSTFINVRATNDFLGSLGGFEGAAGAEGTSMGIPCRDKGYLPEQETELSCSKIVHTLKGLLESCGDEYGRTIAVSTQTYGWNGGKICFCFSFRFV